MAQMCVQGKSEKKGEKEEREKEKKERRDEKERDQLTSREIFPNQAKNGEYLERSKLDTFLRTMKGYDGNE